MKQGIEQNETERGRSDSYGIGLLILALTIVVVAFSAIAPQHMDIVTATPEFSQYRATR